MFSDTLTKRGRLLFKKNMPWVLAAICTLLLWLITSAYRFLAANQPTGEGVLVVEGWIPKSTLAASLSIFNHGHYQYLVVVGGPTQDAGRSTTTYADLAASRLEHLGFDNKRLIKINVPPVRSERTLTGMLDVRRWLVG
jgi:hypothetical protein